MFTGIVEEVGVVTALTRSAKSAQLKITASKVVEDMRLGDSIAVNGVCLTAVSYTSSEFIADVMPETFRKTNLIRLKPGDPVNLERALALGGRLGGHLVSGHVDGVATITGKHREANAFVYRFTAPPEVMRYIISKGSVAVDGISLTVAATNENGFSVSVIPHTATATTLGRKGTGDVVNLENDIIGKYVERFLGLKERDQDQGEERDIQELLRANGFIQ